MQSKYLEAFQTVAQEAKDSFELVGDCLLVEEIADDEFSKSIKTDSGEVKKIIFAEGAQKQINGLRADRPVFVKILLVGQGSPDDEGNIVPWDVNPGDICLVGATSIKKFSVFGKLVSYGEASLGLIRAQDIQARWFGQEAFDRFFGTLNQTVAPQVEP